MQLKEKYNQYTQFLINQYFVQFLGFDANKLIADATQMNLSKSNNSITVYRYFIDFLEYIVDCVVIPPNIDKAKITYAKQCLTD